MSECSTASTSTRSRVGLSNSERSSPRWDSGERPLKPAAGPNLAVGVAPERCGLSTTCRPFAFHMSPHLHPPRRLLCGPRRDAPHASALANDGGRPMVNSGFKHGGPSGLGILAAVLLALAVILPMRVTRALAASSTPPTQWIAKMFTEARGQAPTTNDWNFWLAYYGSNACSVSTLATLGDAIYTDSTFTNAYPEATSKPQRVTALVRGVYSHDPNSNDWSAYYTPYANGTNTWVQTVGNIFNNGVFGTYVAPAVCGASPDYGFGYSRPIDILAGGSRSESTLQSLLNAAQGSCGTVSLAQTELVRVGNTQALSVPPCVTLTTAGSPGPTAYASMARIVPDGP